MQSIRLDGQSLTRDRLVAVAKGATVELDPRALQAVRRAADFLAEQVRREEPIYGVSTGFGSNADKLLGAHPLRDEYVSVRDVFDAEVIYSLSRRDGSYAETLYRRTYSITDDGTVSLGDPEPVVMQTVYAPAESPTPANTGDEDAVDDGLGESVDLTSDLVPLIERAVRSDNTVPLKVIAPTTHVNTDSCHV